MTDHIGTAEAASGAVLTDEQIIDHATRAKNGPKFERLWRGDLEGYKRERDAHMALCRMLAFYVSGDLSRSDRGTQIDRLFRSSGMMSDAWDQPEGKSTHGRQIVASVLDGQKDFYRPYTRSNQGRADNRRGETTGEKDGPKIGLTKELADEITTGSYFARDDGGKLYRFENGAYRPGADFFVRQQVKEILERKERSAEWERKLAKEVIEYILLGSRRLWDEPPCHSINVKNGLLDIESGELRAHSPEWLSTIQIPIEYLPSGGCPKLDRFLAQVFPADAVELAWEVFGDGLTPDRSIQKAFLLVGEGGNGKGTFLALYSNFLGRTNVSSVSLQKLEKDRFALAVLHGKLANVCGDLSSEKLVGTSTFKGITGNDRLTAEHKFCQPFELTPYCRLLFSANHLPQSNDASKAFFDRWITIPFDQPFRGGDQERSRKDLDAELSSPQELSGALNKALAALRILRARGRFSEPESTKAALAEFQAITDPFTIWFREHVIQSPEFSVPQADLLDAYNRDCQRQRRPPMTRQAFGRALKRMSSEFAFGQRTVTGRVVRVYLGLRLRPAPAIPVSIDSLDSRDSRDFSHFVSTTNRAEQGGKEEVLKQGEGGIKVEEIA